LIQYEPMAVVIRLTRMGKKGERKFRVVVKEKRSRRDGDFVESLGWYEKDKTGQKKQIDMERFAYWVSKGALPSPTVSEIVKK
jgi:small subunit ribosomal protein S16